MILAKESLDEELVEQRASTKSFWEKIASERSSQE